MFPHSLLQGATWYPILFDTPLNAVRSAAIWLTLTLFIAYMVYLCILKGDKKRKFVHASIPFIVAYACALVGAFLILTFMEDGIERILFIPLLLLLLSITGSAILLHFKRSKTLYVVLGILIGGALLTTLVCMGVHFYSGKAAENNWLENKDVESLWLYVSSILAVLVLVFIAWKFDKKEFSFDSKSIAYAAICIAMSFALSFMRIVRLPQGGSITPASLLPLMIYAYMFGTRKGVFAGFTYGLLQALQDPSVLHPAQFLLDYPVAFAWVGLVGIFSQLEGLRKTPQLQFAIGGILAGLGRFCMHFLSGTFAFGVFAPKGTPAALYSFVYQAGYVLPDLAIAIVVGIVLFTSKSFVKESRKFHKKSA